MAKTKISMRMGSLIALVLLLSSAISPAYGQDGLTTNPYGRDIEFTVAVRERQSLIGEVPLHLAKDGSLSVNLIMLVRALSVRITPQAKVELLALDQKEGRVTFDALKRLNYELIFNDAELELSISLPLVARPRQDYSVMGPERAQVGDFDRVAPFSFAANIRLAGDYSHSDLREDFSASGSLSILGRAGPIAYQAAFRSPGNGAGLLHDGSRIIIDDVERALRWQAGDIRPFSASPVGGDDVLGIGVSRETDILQPGNIARVRGTQTFSIEDVSEVTISVNGRVVARRMFTPGNYNIADFPFVLGRNQIELLIQNQAGEQQRLSFNQYLDSRLLEAGRDDFGLVFGIASRLGFNQSRQYDPNNWTLNAHYIKGVSEKLTLGIATTLNRQIGVILATGVHGGVAGITSGRAGLNFSSNGTQIGVLGLGFVRALSGSDQVQTNRALRFGLDGRFDFKDSSNSLFNVSLGYTWPLTRRMGGNVDLRLSGKTGSASFQTSYSLTRDIRFDVSFDWRFNKNDLLAGPGISIGLSRSFGSGGQSRARYDSRRNEGQVSFGFTPKAGLGQWSHSLEATTSDQSTNIVSNQSAFFNRFEFANSASGSWQDGQARQRISFRLGSALAFANGRFAFGRPVSDSFAIIAGHKTLGKRTISLASRGSESGTMARTGLFGPALVTGLGTYAARLVSVSVEDAPEGYDIGSGTFRVAPPLFGGYAFVVGSDTATSVIGTLLLANGQPAALVAGSASSPDWPQVSPITVFTNANGQFSVSGLGKGRWSLKMRGLAGTFDFTIGSSQSNFIEVGSIRAGVDQ